MALDAAFCPVVSSADPRAEGLPLDPHGNSLLSLLSAGFLCPLGDPVTPDLPSPGRPGLVFLQPACNVIPGQTLAIGYGRSRVALGRSNSFKLQQTTAFK